MDTYPAAVDEGTASNAERLVFALARRAELGFHYMALHSLLLPRHRRNFTGQADFVVLTPAGLLVLEVKGGTLSLVDGNWYSSGAHGSARIQSPFEQANNNMYSLRDAASDASMPFTYRKHLLGYGVLFPDCRFSVDAAGIEKEVLFDAAVLSRADPLAHVIRSLERFWTTRLGAPPETFETAEWHRLRAWLRPRYYGVPSLRADRITLQEKLVALLDEQMDFIATARGKQRIICRGGAGTGKTLMGLESCRMRQDSGEAVAFVVRNPCLAGYIRARGHDPGIVRTISDLESLPPDSLDFLCLDEAQDAMNVEEFVGFDRVLKGGLEQGSWLLLLDSENQSGLEGRYDEEWLAHLVGLSEADVWLPRNVRNTEEVIEATWQLTGRDIGKRGTGHGRKVQYVPYKDDQHAAELVAKAIKDLVESEVPPGEIAILGRTGPGQSPLATGVAGHGIKITTLDEQNAGQFPFETVASSSVRNFKGLEAYAVIIDAGEFEPGKIESAEFYVAASRPTSILFVAYPKARARELARLQDRKTQVSGDTE